MKNKKKPIQVNVKALRKLLRSISKPKFRNALTATLAVVLVVGVFAATPQLQNYFRSKPSQAAGNIIGNSDIGTAVNWMIGPEQALVHQGENSVPRDMNGTKILYTNAWGHTPGIYLYDLITKQSLKITDHFDMIDYAMCGLPRMSGNTVVYCDMKERDLYKYDIPTQIYTKLTNNGPGGYEELFDVDQSWVVFGKLNTQYPDWPLNIYLMDMNTGKGYFISPSSRQQWGARIDGNWIVWEDDRNSHTSTDIYAYDIANKQEIIVAVEEGVQSYPYVWGNRIVYVSQQWGDYWNSNLYMYDTVQFKKTQLTFTNGTKTRYWPVAWGDYIFYTVYTKPSGSSDIYMLDLKNLHEYPVCSDPNRAEHSPTIWGSKYFINLAYDVWDLLPNPEPMNPHGNLFMRRISLMQTGGF